MRIVQVLLLSLFLALSSFSCAEQNDEEQDAALAAETDFLKTCVAAEVDISDPSSRIIAMAHCMGHIRGIAEGHVITVIFSRSAGNFLPLFWCIPKDKTDGELYASVIAWTIVNKKEYETVKKNSENASSDVVLYVVMKALVQSYPCVTQ